VIAGFLSIKGAMPFVPILGTSMEPMLRAGDLIMIQEASPDDVEVGDVIVFDVPSLTREAYNYPALVAHRVITVEATDFGLYFRTQGDNVPGEDPFTVRDRDIRGTVGKQIPYAGFPLLFLQSKQGLIFIIVALSLFAVFLFADEIGRGRRTLQRGIFAPVLDDSRRNNKILERRIESTEGQITGTQQAMEKFAEAIAEYAVHLKSHTSAIQGLSEASHELKSGASEQNQFLSALVEKLAQGGVTIGGTTTSAGATPATGKQGTAPVTNPEMPSLEEGKAEIEKEVSRVEKVKQGEVPGCFRSRRHKPDGGEGTIKAG